MTMIYESHRFFFLLVQKTTLEKPSRGYDVFESWSFYTVNPNFKPGILPAQECVDRTLFG